MSSLWDLPMILRTQQPGGLLRVNSAFEQTFGHAAGGLAAESFLEWIHPDDRDELSTALAAKTGRGIPSRLGSLQLKRPVALPSGSRLA